MESMYYKNEKLFLKAEKQDLEKKERAIYWNIKSPS